MPACSSASFRMRPAGPTNGCPARSSSLPGCSPTSITSAPAPPSPNTVCVARRQRWHARQPRAALFSVRSVRRSGSVAGDDIYAVRVANRARTSSIRNMKRKIPASTFAIANDAPAIVVNPSSAATSPTSRKISSTLEHQNPLLSSQQLTFPPSRPTHIASAGKPVRAQPISLRRASPFAGSNFAYQRAEVIAMPQKSNDPGNAEARIHPSGTGR